MIEIICRENLQNGEQEPRKEKRCLPKNIRQVGSPRGRHKIYIEDYVYTYIRNLARKKDPCAAIFLGTAQVDRDIRYTFISGAVECGAAVFQWDNFQLDDSFWDYIYKEKKQYFPDLEIVGWFLGRVGQPMELAAAVESAHRKYFAGRDKLLMLMDVLEGEEIFFVHEQGYLQKREGYYIYYEKNFPMQEYMVSKHEEERQLDKLAGLGGAAYGSGGSGRSLKDTEFASLWDDIQSEESHMLPRTGEFADLYQELQQLDSAPFTQAPSQEMPPSPRKAQASEMPAPQKSLAEPPDRISQEPLSEMPSSPRKKPLSEALPSPRKKPLSERASGAKQNPLLEVLPSAKRKPLSEVLPSAKRKPLSERASGAKQNPLLEVLPSAKQKPLSEELSSAKQKPLSEEPFSAKQKPLSEGLSSAKQKPLSEGASSAKQKPLSEELFSAKQKTLSEGTGNRRQNPPQENSASYAEGSEEAGQETWASQTQMLFQEILGIQNRNSEKGGSASAYQDSDKEEIPQNHRETVVQDQAKGLREKLASRKIQLEGKGKNSEKIFAKKNEKESKTPAEEALESYRNMAWERHGRQIAKQNRNFLYTASSFFLVILCVIGITTINNYRKMQEVEETLHILKATEENSKDSKDTADGQGTSQNGSEEEDGLVVESIASQVTPLEEQGQQKQANSQNTADSDSEQQAPKDTAEGSASEQERVRYYTVQPGDTLDSICQSIYNSLDVREELCKLNGIEDGNKIFVGQKLQLP